MFSLGALCGVHAITTCVFFSARGLHGMSRKMPQSGSRASRAHAAGLNIFGAMGAKSVTKPAFAGEGVPASNILFNFLMTIPDERKKSSSLPRYCRAQRRLAQCKGIEANRLSRS